MENNNNMNNEVNFGGIGMGLLRFCLEHSDGNVLETDLTQYQRNPADYEWLKEALNNLESESQKMKKLVSKLSESEITEQQIVYALEGIQYFIEDLDLANDLVKLNLQPIVDLLNHSNADIRRWSAWIFASASQNNPNTQLALITKHNLLSVLCRAILVETNDQVKDKQLYAISALTSGLTLMNDFVDTHNGLVILVRLLRSPLPTTQFKALWFLKKLLQARPTNKGLLLHQNNNNKDHSEVISELTKFFADIKKLQTVQLAVELLVVLIKDDAELSYQCKCLGLDKILINLLKTHEDEEFKAQCKQLLTLVLVQKRVSE